jgi:hypothetical protein
MIAIKDMDMPRTCAACDLRCRLKDDEGGFVVNVCVKTLRQLPEPQINTSRHPDCPLIELENPPIAIVEDKAKTWVEVGR